MTDTELFEKRYPVLLHEYSVRLGSGGDGFHKGGDGVVRDIEFLYPLEVSCLMERRALAPYGLLGGEEGARGLNQWFYKLKDGTYRKKSLGGKCTVKVSKGDRIVINTPGGGGYGKKEKETTTTTTTTKATKTPAAVSEQATLESSDGVHYPIKSPQPSILTGSVGMRSIIQNTN